MKQAEPKAKPKAKSVRSATVAVVDQPSGHLLTLSAQPYSFLISSTLARLTGVDSAPWPPICGDVPAWGRPGPRRRLCSAVEMRRY